MQSKFSKIFKKKKVVIGVIHFPPLLGYSGFPGFKTALHNALKDLNAFEKGGVDGIIIENNYDIPHKIFVEPQTILSMVVLGTEVRTATKLPIGVSVLWNDFKAAFSIAKIIGAKFIRIPVFVDKVKTNYGIVTSTPKIVLEYQKEIKAQDIALFTDIHVKHAKLLNKRPIEKSALKAIESGSDSLIITGKWTAKAPDLKELVAVRKSVGDFPILIGSGADKKNIKELLKHADGVIVSTSLKQGSNKKGEVNIKGWKQRINREKVRKLIETVKALK